MAKLQKIKLEDFGYKFIDAEFLPAGQNENYLRFLQTGKNNDCFRHLFQNEIEILLQNGNNCKNWNDVLVQDQFIVSIIKNTTFAGLVRIGRMENFYLKYHDFSVPVGITNSTVISCDIGENCAIHNCTYLANYIIGEYSILSKIDEMCTTDHAKFGEGIVKDGENEDVRVTIEALNEAGGREIYPFYDMITADAFLWSKFRDDKELIKKFQEITQNSCDSRRGYYGKVGAESVIKSCRIIKDVNFGNCVYVKGANKLKNLTIKSSSEEPSQIGEGTELVNGIIGFGSRIFYGAKAVRFVMGNNCELKYGARLIHSVLGDNSTISCCEVLNTLIFPFHEQHHNNSFLIAAMIQGQSNLAAAATIGSNHNTRGNDGEIIAGRGFWPGLSSTLKHNCKFASFVLISKGNYTAELNIEYPFSLVINNEYENQLEIMPAYYWMHNMYSIERNNKKFPKRDKRKTKTQHIETNYLAPDSVYDIINAIKILKMQIENAWKQEKGMAIPIEKIIDEHYDDAKKLFVNAENAEHSKRKVKILKAIDAYKSYHEMLVWYGVTTLAEYFVKTNKSILNFQMAKENIEINNFDFSWVNIGGQLVPEKKLKVLFSEIKSNKLDTWQKIHNAYDQLYSEYESDKVENAYAVLCYTLNVKKIDDNRWNALLNMAYNLRLYIEEQIFFTKNKDYDNSFRGITYNNKDEQIAVLGNVQDNALIKDSKEETKQYKKLFDSCRI